MKRSVAALLVILSTQPESLLAFCGFYVAKADTKIFNRASQVVLIRDGDRTVMTMANDFQGDPKEFAVVIPVPTFIRREQIHVAEKALIDHLDAYSSPRLVEYFDPDPCSVNRYMEDGIMVGAAAPSEQRTKNGRKLEKSLGVTVEASYTVGEYDILILSAKESGGLETWLVENGYRIPSGASSILGSYIRQNMRFFVAKVNLKAQSKLGFTYLRPLQVAYESPKFMLPIRLGTVNAKGPQELFIYTLTRKGRVETTNYRTVKLPSDAEIPVYVKQRFGPFYRDLFSRQVEKESMKAVFLEYAWDMNWCDPCAADPLSAQELRQLGVFWVGGTGADRSRGSGAQDVFLTRLHVRYDKAHFPEDLVFQETGNRENFQSRFVLRHEFKGASNCPAATEYRAEVRRRQEQEATLLAQLTGWKLSEIRKSMNLRVSDSKKAPQPEKKWYETIWD